MDLLSPLLIFLFAYALGSIPTALWITKVSKGVDIREVGSKHGTATNTLRIAGWLPAVIVLAFDLLKGFLPVFLVLKFSSVHWWVIFAGAAAVAGHCWPIWASFRGGMGLATTGGFILAVNPLAFLIVLALLILVLLTIRHAARAAILTCSAAPFLLFLFHLPWLAVWSIAVAALIVVTRYTSDWNRQYRELWLDR
jgi:acyl phosphate:glycerol-3-phosphate acyltransferase